MTRTLFATALIFLLVVLVGCEDVKEVSIKATDVKFDTSKSNLQAATVQGAIEEVATSVPKLLKAGTGIKIDGTTISAKTGTGSTDVATGNHKHIAADTTNFSATATKAMGSKGTSNPLNHDRYGEADLAASATIKALKTENTSLKTSVTTLQGKVSTLESKVTSILASVATDGCPAGFTRDAKATKFILCKRGSNEMVKVGDFWIDRYEARVVSAALWNSGKCDGVGGTVHGTSSNFKDDFPSSFPDSGNWTVPLYACSVFNLPSRYMTWFQAQQACALAGKHLCTNGEWQMAAAGTPDNTLCNINSQGKWSIGYSGHFPKCVSNWGALDMVGNVGEWVDWWGQAGRDWGTTGFSHSTPWPISGGYGDAQDQTSNIEGQAVGVSGGSGINGMPAAAIRGGSYAEGVKAGIFNIARTAGPVLSSNGVGARCCLRGR